MEPNSEKSNETNQNSNPKTRPSAVGAWVLAARPKTLAAAAMPVVVGLALAWSDIIAGRESSTEGKFLWIPACCCFLFALFAQIAANFINDYADFKKGADTEERKGPARSVASGWISPNAMLVGTFVALAIACSFGLATVYYGGWKLVVVGALSCLFCALYSAGPVPLAYVGLGDVLVVVFFGFVATAFTYFVQIGRITLDAALLGLAMGFAVDKILVENNYRDRDEDRANKKYMLVSIFGERFGRYFYLTNGLIVVATLAFVMSRRNELLSPAALGALLVYFAFHMQAWRALARIRSGKALVKILAFSSRNVVILGVLLAFALCS